MVVIVHVLLATTPCGTCASTYYGHSLARLHPRSAMQYVRRLAPCLLSCCSPASLPTNYPSKTHAASHKPAGGPGTWRPVAPHGQAAPTPLPLPGPAIPVGPVGPPRPQQGPAQGPQPCHTPAGKHPVLWCFLLFCVASWHVLCLLFLLSFGKFDASRSKPTQSAAHS